MTVLYHPNLYIITNRLCIESLFYDIYNLLFSSIQVRPSVPTSKPADIRAKSSAAKRPAAASTSEVAVIDLTDDDDSNKASGTANKGRVPPSVNPVRTQQVSQQVRGQQQVASNKTAPVAHSRVTQARTSMPAATANKQPAAPNILQTRAPTTANKPGQPLQMASSRLAEFTQVAQQQGQQVQILQTVPRGQIPVAAGQQQPQRTIATQQVSPSVVSQARVPPLQTRTVTIPAGAAAPQLVSLPGNAANATIPARGVTPILQQSGQPQQVQLQQVIQPGQAAQIIQTPAGQVVMAPAMSSGVATVLTTQPIQAGTVQYQIVNSQGVNNPTVQQMLQIRQQQQQQATARTAQVIGTRLAVPAGASPNVQQVRFNIVTVELIHYSHLIWLVNFINLFHFKFTLNPTYG